MMTVNYPERDTLLVTGSRDCRAQGLIFADLDSILICVRPIRRLVHGDCPTGADRIADFWARARGLEVLPYTVNHELDGPWPGAGPRRNERMVRAEAPRLRAVCAFSVTLQGYTRGTGGCVELVDRYLSAVGRSVPRFSAFGR